MTVHNKTTRAILCVTAALAWAGAAEAQGNPEAGDVAPAAGGQAQFGASAGGGAQVTTTTTTPAGQTTTTTTEAPVDPNADAHSAVVGHFGVGFFGVADLPLCDTGNACADGAVGAPTIGVRYWLNDLVGLEGGIGFAFSSTDLGDTTVSRLGFALHAAVPLALAHAGYFTFEVVPQLNFGLASGSTETTVLMTSSSVDTSGLLIEIGGKVGGEISFGFIDIPQLALQGTLGLMIRHEGRGAEAPAGAGTVKTDVSTTSIATGVDEAPWKLFTGNISAIYYFGG